MFAALEKIITTDPQAILASRLLTSLEESETVSMQDLCDLRLMNLMGYHRFMLSDGVSRSAFMKASKAWKNYLSTFCRRED